MNVASGAWVADVREAQVEQFIRDGFLRIAEAA